MIIFSHNCGERVKNICFHQARPWVLVGFLSGEIQLWNYSLGFMVKSFFEHQGPVRGIDFHPKQDIFVSGGDDGLIKIWDLRLGTCISTLIGHTDFVRTVQFHPSGLPFVVSSSDDRTARIFNFQSQTCVAILTGHEHFVMSATFHKKLPIVLSSSLDKSAHIWDVSSIIKPPQDAAEAYFQTASSNSIDEPASHRCHMETHSDGVNWAIFHPSKSLVFTASDDRTIKIWKFLKDRAWELETLRGHTDNVCCLAMHPFQDILVSASEDKTIRAWDTGTGECFFHYSSPNDRFWTVTSHPTRHLFATGHDSGFMIFKVYNDDPVSTSFGNVIYYTDFGRLLSFDVAKRKAANIFNFNITQQRAIQITSQSLAIASLGQPSDFNPRTMVAHNPQQPTNVQIPPSRITSIRYNPVMDALLLMHVPTSNITNGPRSFFQILSTSKGVNKSDEASHAVWVTPNRIATLDTAPSSSISFRKLDTSIFKKMDTPFTLAGIWFAGLGFLLLEHSDSKFSLFDIKTKGILVTSPPLTTLQSMNDVIWTNDRRFSALVAQRSLSIVNRELVVLNSIIEKTEITAASWTTVADIPVCIYTTKTHLKYATVYGIQGIVKSFQEPAEPIFVAKCRGQSVFCTTRLPREASIVLTQIDINPTEFLLKTYLTANKFDAVSSLISKECKSAPMAIGNALVSYISKSGYPEVALQFATDLNTKLELAYSCKRIDIALQCVQKLGTKSQWTKLGNVALKSNNLKVAQTAFQNAMSLDKLSFLYFLTGHSVFLGKMFDITKNRQRNLGASLNNLLMLGDPKKYIKDQIAILESTGQLSLALACAQANSKAIDGLSGEIERLSKLVPPSPQDPQDTPDFNSNHWTSSFESSQDLELAYKPLQGLSPVLDTSIHWEPRKLPPLSVTLTEKDAKAIAAVNKSPAFSGKDWSEFGFEVDADETEFVSTPQIQRQETEQVDLSQTASAWADSESDDEFEFDTPQNQSQGGEADTVASKDRWVNSLYPAHHAVQGRLVDAKSLLTSSYGVFQTNNPHLNAILDSLNDIKVKNGDKATPSSTAVAAIAQITHYNVLISILDQAMMSFATQKLDQGLKQCKDLLTRSLFWIPGMGDLPAAAEGNKGDPVSKIVALQKTGSNYLLAFRLGLELIRIKSIQPSTPEEQLKLNSRRLDLIGLMTHVPLTPKHYGQMLFIALKKFGNKKVRNYVISHSLCKRIRELVPLLKEDPSLNPSDMEVYTKWELLANKLLRAPLTAGDIPVSYNPSKKVVTVCAVSFTPLYSVGPTCSFCFCAASSKFSNSLCPNCELGKFS